MLSFSYNNCFCLPTECFCSKTKRTVMCGTEEYAMISFSCEKPCGRLVTFDILTIPITPNYFKDYFCKMSFI